jgi:hypothetical protein
VASSEGAPLLRREVLQPAMSRPLRRCHLELLHCQDPRQRCAPTALTRRYSSRVAPLGQLLWWIYLHLRVKKISSMISLVASSSPSVSSASSTMPSWGRPATAKSSSSATPTKKKRRHARRSLPTPKMCVTEPPRKGVRRQDQLERFSMKREHNQHT